jgi:hypothetical protein
MKEDPMPHEQSPPEKTNSKTQSNLSSKSCQLRWAVKTPPITIACPESRDRNFDEEKKRLGITNDQLYSMARTTAGEKPGTAVYGALELNGLLSTNSAAS